MVPKPETTGESEVSGGQNGTESEGVWSRRKLLAASGAGVGLAAIAGANLAAATDEHEDDEEAPAEEQDEDDESEDGEDDVNPGAALVDDLVDPTFGYPLAADETDAVTVEHEVELYTEPGEGAHPDFPVAPQPGGEEESAGGEDGDGSQEEVPAEFVFDPVGLHVEPGDIVHFRITAGEHTVTAFHEKFSVMEREMPTRVPGGVPGFTSPPLLDGESWLYQFSTRGVYDILCLPHVFVGMVMRIVVADPEEDDLEDDAFAEPEGDDVPPSAERVLSADQLDPANIVDSGSVAWADVFTPFVANLSGDEEVPPVETDATGRATFDLDEDETELGYVVSVSDIEDVVAAHIHCAPEGENGPVGVTLYDGDPVSSDGVLAEGTVTEPDEDNECDWETIEDVIEAMRNGEAYVNVHTEENPGGEIRGQI